MCLDLTGGVLLFVEGGLAWSFGTLVYWAEVTQGVSLTSLVFTDL